MIVCYLKIGLETVVNVLCICQLTQDCSKSENCLKIVPRSYVNLGTD